MQYTRNLDLLESIRRRRATVSVVGLGYMGLPIALRVAESGFTVLGLDIDPSRVQDINRRRTQTVPAFPGGRSDGAVSTGSFTASADPSLLAAADIILICVPTPLDNDLPDLAHIRRAATMVAAHLRHQKLIILESTSYPGTTDELLREILESTGLKAGTDFYLGFSPERVDPGNAEFDIANTPKIVAGFDQKSTVLMEAFYGTLVSRVVTVSSTKTAEMAKLLENTYRHVNIALANELAIVCHDLGIDVWEVIEAAATKPFGFQAFYPGPGWGGHCVPVDPAYLSWRVRQMGATAKFVELALELNRQMPAYIIQRLREVLESQGKELAASCVLVLGVAYKPDVSDFRQSPAIEIIQLLLKAGASVTFHDPHVAWLPLPDFTLDCSPMNDQTLSSSDITLLHTGHSAFDAAHIARRSRLIFDARNFFQGIPGRIVRL